MIISTMRGYIAQDVKVKEIMTVNGEKFYSVPVSFARVRIPLLISEYLWNPSICGICDVRGYLTNATPKHHTYFRVVDIRCGVEMPLTNEMLITGTIANKKPYLIDEQGRETQEFIVSYVLPGVWRDMRVTVVAKDSAARFFHNADIKDPVKNLVCYLKRREGKYIVTLSKRSYRQED